MAIQSLLSRNIVVASLTTAVLLSAIAPGEISYSASAKPSIPLQFQIGSNKAIDYRGEHTLSAAPYVVNGITMVPVRALAEGLQAKLEWDGKAKEITLSRDGLTVHLKQNSDEVIGTFTKNVKLPAKVAVVKGIAFIPAKSVAQLLGAKTSWDGKHKKITIQTSEAALSYHYAFNQSEEGWKGAFADLPVDYDPAIYELKYGRELLPTANNKTNYGLKLTGMNRSDDLFMYVTKKIEGLKPGSTYQASLSFQLYTDQAGGMMGVGGAPGEAVSIKAGFVNKEPQAVESDAEGHPHYRMNLDKGNQKTEGADMKIVGNMVQPNDELKCFQPVAMQYAASLTANEKGELFVIVGSDSGYEGLTTLYLDDIKITLQPQG
ncbi:copper amine oxidase N-terminal domain-containing protein [Paenibacillus sp. PL91]|uniref:copper amine oxidase N-terminal domain-containing protein n=1 Tax=Paenibacillus sp. PL91 TaxID=2729538 RepID=UPI00145F9D37|nr:copper amine oxidase N-terminal domain-containing protein [Paenibacillus sp. PL91]MBC9202746.1 copper amine oxidase N-terminal domain-containing protein [Paenibacillus sp. PL91]